ncbi:uncharacterized protein LOC115244758 [Formica exsecta]|uniref:uncharacterized protein LOC115244758 n=1 Tax=Formica exsecta TaxID=72781 RepID=UPI0011420912|nr:uncharacterized protein LOC115244758 [Formica exsecta]
MSEHVAHQQQLQRTIERALENFKKIGRSNLTPAKVRSRISTLKEYWSQFSNGHAEVSRKVPEAIRSSFSYFKDNHYDATQAIYENTLDHMADILEELEPVECRSKYSCRVCHKKHHSMLHVDSDSSSSRTIMPDCSSPQPSGSTPEVNSLIASTRKRSPLLLTTTWVTVRCPSGRTAVIRALLDQGSEMTFISESLAQLLRVKRIRMPISVSAVGGINAGTFQHATHIFISHRESLAPSLSTTALILKSLISYTPRRHVDLSSLSYLSDLPRADSDPTSSDTINLIIGADLYSDIIRDGVHKGSIGQPFAQNSIFGWIISGPLTSLESQDPFQSTMTSVHCTRDSISAHHTTSSTSLEEELRRFWEIEELPRQLILTPQEQECEEHFCSTHYRDSDGRYIVRLPFKTSPPIDIGNSRFRAENIVNSLVRRFRDKPEVAKEYSDFITEFERLGHMRPVPMPQGDIEPAVYLPHHGVIRESSSTTRLRVVFNASSVTSNGTSLNDYNGDAINTCIHPTSRKCIAKFWLILAIQIIS